MSPASHALPLRIAPVHSIEPLDHSRAQTAFPSTAASAAIGVSRANTWRLLTARVIATKAALIARYRAAGVPMALVRHAIANAEAQAWLSGFPHLFLPELADEILRRLRQHEVSHGITHLDYAHAA